MVLVYVRGFILKLDNNDPQAVLLTQNDRIDIEDLYRLPIEEISTSDIKDCIHHSIYS